MYIAESRSSEMHHICWPPSFAYRSIPIFPLFLYSFVLFPYTFFSPLLWLSRFYLSGSITFLAFGQSRKKPNRAWIPCSTIPCILFPSSLKFSRLFNISFSSTRSLCSVSAMHSCPPLNGYRFFFFFFLFLIPHFFLCISLDIIAFFTRRRMWRFIYRICAFTRSGGGFLKRKSCRKRLRVYINKDMYAFIYIYVCM